MNSDFHSELTQAIEANKEIKKLTTEKDQHIKKLSNDYEMVKEGITRL